RDPRAHRRDDPQRRDARPRRRARPQGRGQALDRRRRRQDVDRRRPDRRRLRSAVREDERPRPRPHWGHARQARGDPGLPGRRAGKEVVCLLTDMDQPLGAAVGNALEIREAVDTIRGEGPADFTELVIEASARLLALSDLEIDVDEGRRRAEATVADGSAHELYERWIRAQGGDPSLDALPRAPVVRSVEAPTDGTVVALGAIRVGVAALELGAGRRTKEDEVDHAVGVVCLAKRGDRVERGAPLAEVHATDDAAAEAGVAAVPAAHELGD